MSNDKKKHVFKLRRIKSRICTPATDYCQVVLGYRQVVLLFAQQTQRQLRCFCFPQSHDDRQHRTEIWVYSFSVWLSHESREKMLPVWLEGEVCREQIWPLAVSLFSSLCLLMRFHQDVKPVWTRSGPPFVYPGSFSLLLSCTSAPSVLRVINNVDVCAPHLVLTVYTVTAWHNIYSRRKCGFVLRKKTWREVLIMLRNTHGSGQIYAANFIKRTYRFGHQVCRPLW